ncbi:MAG TPA: cell division protein ZapA, partial [Alphaproteobacteria bacterium]|nr:cell division protein ZapA [Alphaproteobacteria bacterium]HBA42030.1 cell division protein ZapA [Alphaproteobacteria bacterium]
MPELTLTVNSRNYDVACGEGEEPHLRELAEFIDGKITAIVGEGGRRG